MARNDLVFQFLLGTLKTNVEDGADMPVTMFQFLLGTLKTT